MKNAIYVFACMLVTSVGSAQELPILKTVPSPTNWTLTDVPVGPILGQIACSPNSSLYFRRESPNENPLEGPITILSSNGKSSSFNPNENTGLQGRVMYTAFNVDENGGIYAVANSSADVRNWYLVSYDSQGHFKSKTVLASPVRASFILPLRNSNFLISGVSPQTAIGQSVPSITSIFAKSGAESRIVKLESDDREGAVDSQSGEFFNPTVQLGNARIAPSGDILVFKASSLPAVQVMDKNGETIRTLQLSPPSENARAFDFLTSGAEIAVAYQPQGDDQKLANGNLVLYDAKTGVSEAVYDTSATRGILACSQGKTLTYLGPSPDHKYFQLGRVQLP